MINYGISSSDTTFSYLVPNTKLAETLKWHNELQFFDENTNYIMFFYFHIHHAFYFSLMCTIFHSWCYSLVICIYIFRHISSSSIGLLSDKDHVLPSEHTQIKKQKIIKSTTTCQLAIPKPWPFIKDVIFFGLGP